MAGLGPVVLVGCGRLGSAILEGWLLTGTMAAPDLIILSPSEKSAAETARAKGVRSRPIIFVHALRNAMLPVITVIGDQAAALLNGAVVVETIFGFPGVGKLMIDAILQRDFNVVLAAIMVTALAIFVMNLLIDLAYSALDPRIRH